MKEFDANVVWVRLDKIREYLIELQTFQNISLEEYLENRISQLAVERLIQIITDAALDINRHILAKLGVLQVRRNWNNAEYFLELERQGLLDLEVATELAQAATMRNILVHLYLDIDEFLVY